MLDPSAPLLVVEDNDEDFEMLRDSFAALALARPIRRFEDGEDVLDYLLRRGPFADPAQSPRPALMLLDLNLPGTDGREVLAAVRALPSLRSLPVVVFTTSAAPGDVAYCFDQGISGYVIKPVDLAKLQAFVGLFAAYWFTHNVLPEIA